MISKDIETPEAFNWKIALALVIAWILVYMCMIKGIASSGKAIKRAHHPHAAPLMFIEINFSIVCQQVVYVTATFPYFVLIIFFFRGVTLPGMSDGLRHLFTPKVSLVTYYFRLYRQ